MRALALIGFTVALCATQAEGAEGARWGYSGAVGPSAWASLDRHYAVCRRGKRQSPIDIRGTRQAALDALRFDYLEGATLLQNNGQTVIVTFPPGNALELKGVSYALIEVHFHAPSEHRINGKRYAAEAHFVHANDKGELAVVGVLFEQGDTDDPILDDLGSRWPAHLGYEYYLPGRPRPLDMLPASHDYYTYQGSLTTPPCSEIVTWLVLKEPRPISHPQMHRIRDAIGGPNARQVQPRHRRAVLR